MNAVRWPLAATLLCALVLPGCGGGGPPLGPIAPPKEGTVVYTIPTEIARFAEVTSMAPGLAMKVRLNRSRELVTEFPVSYEGILTDWGERLIILRLRSDEPIAYGDSGAPVLTLDGRVVGALAYGFWGETKLFLARPIEDMMGLAGAATASEAVAALPQGYRPIGPRRYLAGVSAAFLERLRSRDRSGRLAGLQLMEGDLQAQGASPASASPVIPGQSVSINYISGDLVSGGVIGAVTFAKDDRLFAFGHALDRRGEAAFPASLATVRAMAADGLDFVKVALPLAQGIGTMTQDRNNGIVIESVAPAKTIPVLTKVRIGADGAWSTFRHKVAQDRGNEASDLVTALVAPVDYKFDRYGPGTAFGSITVQVEGGAPETTQIEIPRPWESSTSARQDDECPGLSPDVTWEILWAVADAVYEAGGEVGVPYVKATLTITVIAG